MPNQSFCFICPKLLNLQLYKVAEPVGLIYTVDIGKINCTKTVVTYEHSAVQTCHLVCHELMVGIDCWVSFLLP